MNSLLHNTARTVMIWMADAADHLTGKAGLTLTITASKNGGAFGSISPTVTDRGGGWYALALTSGHTDTLGDLALLISASGADTLPVRFVVEASILDLILEGSRTVRGALRRMDALAKGRKSGGNGPSITLYADDGTTPLVVQDNDPDAGTADVATTIAGD